MTDDPDDELAKRVVRALAPIFDGVELGRATEAMMRCVIGLIVGTCDGDAGKIRAALADLSDDIQRTEDGLEHALAKRSAWRRARRSDWPAH